MVKAAGAPASGPHHPTRRPPLGGTKHVTERVESMRRFVLVTLALLAVMMVGVAGAYFTAQAQVPENIVRAGLVAVSTEPTAAAISIEALAPGAVVTRTLTVVNDGTLPASVIVTAAKKAGITAFYDALTVRATSAGAVLFEGALGVMRTSPLTLAPGARCQIDFAIGLPATAGNDVAGDYAKLTLYVDAEQVR
jgi:hypothetical protein